MKNDWKDVIGHEDNYMINSEGLLLNKNTGKIKVATDLNSSGYPRHVMYYSDKPDRRFVHIMVANHFISNPENKKEVNHIDCNKLNYIVSNLEWVTKSENCKHRDLNKELIEYNKNLMALYERPYNKNICPVASYDIDNNFIQSFRSITEASNGNDTNRVRIQRNIGIYINDLECKYLKVAVRFDIK